jgi:hypothetical protein
VQRQYLRNGKAHAARASRHDSAAIGKKFTHGIVRRLVRVR